MKILSTISDVIWGWPLIVLLCGTHLFLTIRLKWIQRYLWKAIGLSFRKDGDGRGDVGHFGALMTALAATIGTGNIVGVSTAIALGGPGAVLWMWLTGVFGIATKYAEALLSVKYRIQTRKGHFAGGPMYVMRLGLKSKWMAIGFSVFTAIAAFGIGNTVQANSIATLVQETFHVSPWISGAVMTAFTALVILGGIRSISRVCEKLIPFMAVSYIGGCLIILVMHWQGIPHTLGVILSGAVHGQAALGGFAGAGVRDAIRYGVARGLFSNESGLGSAPIVAAAAKTKNPVEQALVSSTGTFWDTVVVCAITGLVLVNSGEWLHGLNGASLTQAAFADIPVIGPVVLCAGLLTFVFSTILGWSYYGERAIEYLFGHAAILPYRWLWVAAVMAGSVVAMPAVWIFADIANAFMALPNLISLILLNKVIVDETRKYIGTSGASKLRG